MKEKRIFIGLAVILFIILISLIIYFFPSKAGFTVSPDNIHSITSFGKESVINIKIINKALGSQEFRISFGPNLQGIAFIDEDEFTLGIFGVKNLEIHLKNMNNVSYVYSGKIMIETPSFMEEIPVIFNVDEEYSGSADNIVSREDLIFFANLKILILVVAAFVLLILVLYFYFSKSRDKLLTQLKEQHREELVDYSRNKEVSKEEVKKVMRGISTKKASKKEKKKEEGLERIKERQVREISEFKKMRKEGKNTKELREKVEAWGRRRAMNFSLEQQKKKSEES